MPNQWYAQIMGEEVGPMSGGQLKQLAAQQRITPDDQIRKGESGNWVSAERVKGLFDGDAPTKALAKVDEKPCPICAEMVKVQAKKCRFCGESLSEKPRVARSKIVHSKKEVTGKRSRLWNGVQYFFGCLYGIIGSTRSIVEGDAGLLATSVLFGLVVTPYTWDRIYKWSGLSLEHGTRNRWIALLAGLFLGGAIIGANADTQSTSRNASLSLRREFRIGMRGFLEESKALANLFEVDSSVFNCRVQAEVIRNKFTHLPDPGNELEVSIYGLAKRITNLAPTLVEALQLYRKADDMMQKNNKKPYLSGRDLTQVTDALDNSKDRLKEWLAMLNDGNDAIQKTLK